MKKTNRLLKKSASLIEKFVKKKKNLRSFSIFLYIFIWNQFLPHNLTCGRKSIAPLIVTFYFCVSPNIAIDGGTPPTPCSKILILTHVDYATSLAYSWSCMFLFQYIVYRLYNHICIYEVRFARVIVRHWIVKLVGLVFHLDPRSILRHKNRHRRHVVVAATIVAAHALYQSILEPSQDTKMPVS